MTSAVQPTQNFSCPVIPTPGTGSWDLTGHMPRPEPITVIEEVKYADWPAQGHVISLFMEICELFTVFLGWDVV